MPPRKARIRTEETMPRCRATAASTNAQCKRTADRPARGSRSNEPTRCHHHVSTKNEHPGAEPYITDVLITRRGSSVSIRVQATPEIDENTGVAEENEPPLVRNEGRYPVTTLYVTPSPPPFTAAGASAGRPHTPVSPGGHIRHQSSRPARSPSTAHFQDTALERQWVQTQSQSLQSIVGTDFTAQWNEQVQQSIPIKQGLAQSRNENSASDNLDTHADLYGSAILNNMNRLSLGEASTQAIAGNVHQLRQAVAELQSQRPNGRNVRFTTGSPDESHDRYSMHGAN